MESFNFNYQGEFPENYEQKCPVVILCDVSISMEGSPIAELNKGLQAFERDVQEDDICKARLDVAVLSFGSSAKVEHDFALMDEYGMPRLMVNGTTNLEAGMRTAMEKLDDRKSWYRSTRQTFYRPYIILITDGMPNEDPNTTGLTTSIKEAVQSKKYNFWPVGVDGANMELLNSMACPDVKGSLPAMQMSSANFVKLFQWLSSSFAKISKSREGDILDLTPEKENNPFSIEVS